MKRLAALILVFMFVLAGCTPAPAPEPPEPADRTTFRIASLKGPTTMGIVNLMADVGAGTARHDYQFSMYGKADEITGLLATGGVDVALIPCNLAAVLYQRLEGAVQMAGINTLGVLYFVETGDTIHSVGDLRGKTIYTTGKGTTPEFALNYVLAKNGIDPAADVTIEYKSESTEVAAMLAGGDDIIAMLPQPYVATVMAKNDKVRICLDLTEEWENASEDGSTIVTGVVCVRTAFAQEYPEAFAEFMEDYRASVDKVATDPDGAAALIGSYDIVPEAIAKAALPYCNITLLTGDEMTTKTDGYLAALYEQNPDSVGGKLPDEDFYLK
ncbi:MAG TPA: ABC transporter substrate-binding protein [Candidatus Acidoferrum sp.]|nr:ABC transporter substrate-binding protein [Candidatus Acidoferrum sp.]